MASESFGSRAVAYVRGWSEKWSRHLAAFTTVWTFLLILLGVYTAASGSGLACSGQWPMCDGGLLPQTLPSFIEWFHRLIAMFAGFFILGTFATLWVAYDSRRIRAASGIALLATPLQALLGGATVFQYTPPVQTAHHGAAMLIFAGLFAATLWAYESHGTAPDVTDTAVSDADADRADGTRPSRSDD
jgi:cytochrome c oxidase assembly protein subunit 15